MNVRIGTCGFRSSQEVYSSQLSSVEVQHTFYQPPQVKTLEGWRAAAPKGFEFTLKAWQLITHASSSPTYKRLKKKLSEAELDDAGYFRPTPIVAEALKVTLESAKALKARTILFQCPSRFTPTPENVANLYKFFGSIKRGTLRFAWEPRGAEWTGDIVREICRDLDLWHTVDPFARPTVTPARCYFRLHGIPRWRYTYDDEELAELAEMLPKRGAAYVFFNNITMRQDAVRFEQILRSQRNA
jgi:uncharacterized protein YecE (DUF72 family)